MGYCDPYEVIGVPRYVQSDDEVERAFHNRLAALPPTADPAMRQAITEAYQTINTQERRVRYNLDAYYSKQTRTAPTTPPGTSPASSPGSTWSEIVGSELRNLFRWLRSRTQQGRRLWTFLTILVLAAASLVESLAPFMAFSLLGGGALLLAIRTKRLYHGSLVQQLGMAFAGAGLGYAVWVVLDVAAEMIIAGLVGAAVLVVGIPLVLLYVFARALGGTHHHYYD